MEYIISSRGRPIGTSELDFFRIDGFNRSGWFHPNAYGETLMPTVALVYPAMRAFIARDVRDENGRSLIQPDFRTSTAFADLAEAYHRVAGLELTLHRPDGTLIPTSDVGIQDTEELRKLANWHETYPLGEVVLETEPWYEELQRDLEDSRRDWTGSDDDLEDLDDLEELQSRWADSDDELGEDVDEPWLPAEEVVLPRYQVHLLLSEENAIP